MAGPTVQCAQLVEDDIGDHGLIFPAYLCTCGCVGCLSVCDGKGPTFGATLSGDGQRTVDDFIVPLIRIDRHLPEVGRLGVYIRMRGLTLFTLEVFGGDPNGIGEDLVLLGTALVPSNPGGDFVEHVFYDQLVDPESSLAAPLSWSSQEKSPSLLALLPPANTRGHTLIEIDCVIPFYVE